MKNGEKYCKNKAHDGPFVERGQGIIMEALVFLKGLFKHLKVIIEEWFMIHITRSLLYSSNMEGDEELY